MIIPPRAQVLFHNPLEVTHQHTLLVVIPKAGYAQIMILELNQTPWMNGVATHGHRNKISFGVVFCTPRYIQKKYSPYLQG